ncbi:uncharacterized protein LOC142333874 isoform X1 [Lycorma delicatula]|uniref:uncharacterized protein LOC142333874 isoform X1 n=1 Tax=Lycorma delicatula TaxID=130591 RepID=UPI003F512438
MKLFISILIVTIFFNEIYTNLEAGTYMIKLKNISYCTKLGKNSIKGFSIKLVPVNQTHVMISFNSTVENDLNGWLRPHIYIKGKGSKTWNTVLDVSLEQCKFVEEFAKNWVEEVFRIAGKNYSCIFGKGDYMVKDYLFDGENLPKVPVFPYGDFRVELSVYSNRSSFKVLESCFLTEGEIVPRYENRRKMFG